MKLIPKSERKQVLRQSYSIRWMVAGFVFTMAETFASVMGASVIPGPKWVAGIVIGLIFAGGFVARIVAQNWRPYDSEQDRAQNP